MLAAEFEHLVKGLCLKADMREALDMLKQCDDSEVAEVAQSLTGQFALAEVDGEKRIYHVTMQENDAGQEEEFVEFVMKENDDLILFVSWFFMTFFDIKSKETCQAAGKTYKQPKRV